MGKLTPVKAVEVPDRRQRIITSAIKCFIKNGVAQTRINEVAKEAQIDQPLIHYYFPKIADLYSAVIDVIHLDLKIRSTRQVENLRGDLIKTLTDYVRGTLLWPREKPGYFSIWIYFYYLASYDRQFYERNRSIRDGGRNRIEMMIYQGIEQNLFTLPHKTTVADAALTIQGILTGNAILAATEGPDFNIKKIEGVTLAAIFNLLGR